MPAKKKTAKKPVKILSSRVVFRGPLFQITSDQVKEPSGVTARRDIVRHPGSVVIIAVQDGPKIHVRGAKSRNFEPHVLLEWQYRYAANQFMWEVPAGRIDEGEEELPAAKRELLEETGYSAKKWKRVLFYYPSPGFMDETMAVYLATGLTAGQATPEEDESIAHRFFPVSKVASMILRGIIRDGKTIGAVLWLEKALEANILSRKGFLQ
ncbi:MAG TPA: NUDIX hydrolase [Terriglobales bacterium]|nr:NUDIX hydrolase [Terriglobales bacterium]